MTGRPPWPTLVVSLAHGGRESLGSTTMLPILTNHICLLMLTPGVALLPPPASARAFSEMLDMESNMEETD